MKIKVVNRNITDDYGKNLLKERGVENVEDFLNPSEENLQDWADLDNISLGIKLIDEVREKNGKVALVVDCDVDGFTSSSIFYQYLKKLNPEIEIDYYIHSGKQHGLEDCWEQIANIEYDLVVVPDAGSNDSIFIKEINCPVLVIDHHILENDDIDEKMILINNQTSQKYKNKHLSGAGVIFQFCRGMDEIFCVDYSKEFLDLAALGICADMMSGLEIENQYFWKYGFKNIKNFFFNTLVEKQSYSMGGEITPITVAFYIVPLINAMIRVGSQEEKERLFLAFIDGERLVPCNKRGAKGTMEKVAIESARECTNARNKQNKIKDTAVEKLESKIFKYDLLSNEVLFIRLEEDDDFPAVLNGLVAMQLSTKYKKPTIVARLNEEGYIRGSARGLSASELTSFKDYLNSTGLFEYTIGHDNAFGISIENKDLKSFHLLANEELNIYDFSNNCYDVNFSRNAYDKDLTNIILDLTKYKKIWSQQNDEPLIYVHDINLTKDEIQVIGKNNDTFKFQKNGITYIKFHAKDLIEEISQFDEIKMEIVGKSNLNEWMGNVTPQIFIEAYEIKNGRLEF